MIQILNITKSLKELEQLKESLKSNEFKIDIVFDRNLFGPLHLYELIERGPLNKSKILSYVKSHDESNL